MSDSFLTAVGAAASVATIVALPLAVWGYLHAIRQHRFARRAASASTFVALLDGFRAAWNAYLCSEDHKRDFHFAEAVNIIETACALHADDLLFGKTKDLMEAYLDEVIVILEEDAKRFEGLISAPTTFNNLLAYREKRLNR